MTELWDAVKPWLPWTVPAVIGALVLLFLCSMIWPARTAQALGILTILWDSIARRFRRRRADSEAPRPRRPTGELMPPTITGFAVPPADRQKPEGD